MASENRIEDGDTFQESLIVGTSHGGHAASTAFRSLVDRSIAAWPTFNYVGVSKDESIDKHINAVRRLGSLDSLLENREYWFFQLRDSFLKQDRVMKWDPNNLDRYILLPIDYGFANNRDCYFVSHFRRKRDHPDPDGTDLRLFQEDLRAQEWSYVWLDWTCMPQVPRTAAEQYYFDRMLRCIPMIVRDCGFEWRFPPFEPRAWVLFEVAEYMLNHTAH